MTIKTEVKTTEKNNVELTVEVPVETFKKSVAGAYRSISAKAKIPGFRAGKIPAKVIDNYYGKGYVLQQALEDSLPDYYSQAVHETKIRPIDRPDIEIISLEEEKELKFKAKVEVEPDVKLPNYKEIKVEQEKLKVKDDEIDAQIDMIRNRFAELNPAPDKVAEKSDHVLINFDGTVDGKAFEGGSAQNFLLEIGSNTLVPEFEAQLIGAKSGDIKDVKIQMPAGVPNKEIAGKEANFKVLVKEVKVKKLPELTDEFVKENTGMENVAALKKEIKEDLQKNLDKQSETQYQHALLEQLGQKSKIDLPEKMIEITIDEMIAEFEQSLKQQGSNKEHYLATTGLTEEKMREDMKKSAEARARQELAFKKFIESEKIEVNDKDLEEAIAELNTDKDKPLTSKDLEEKGLLGYLKSNVLYKKALDLLVKETQK